MTSIFRSASGEAAAGQSSAPKAAFFTQDGREQSIDLPPQIFAADIKPSLVHESVRSRLAAVRAGTSSTKTRAEVRGGGVKPWRQKGTGRARHGSIREPQWVGGGVAHGPKPRGYKLRVNKKVKAAALKSALSDRASEGKVVVVEMPAFEAPKTKRAAELLSDWNVGGKVLLVFSPKEQDSQANAWKSFRNLPLALPVVAASAYTVLEAETVILTKAALDSLAGETLEEGAGAAAAAQEPEADGGPDNPVSEGGQN